MAAMEHGHSMPTRRIVWPMAGRWTALNIWWTSRALMAARALRDAWRGRPDRRSSPCRDQPVQSSIVLPLIGPSPPAARGGLAREHARSVRHPPASASLQPRTAVLLDTYTPELARHVLARHAHADRFVPMAMPIRLTPWSPRPSGWAHEGATYRARWPAVRRAVGQRLAASQGAGRRQAAIVEGRRQIARAYAAHLSPLHTHLVVDLGLLPHLQALGMLAGRTIEVLAAELPMGMVQAQLDVAARAHPHEPDLRDFHVDPALLAAEQQALQAAQWLVTPHVYLASQASRWTAARIERLAWYGEPRRQAAAAAASPLATRLEAEACAGCMGLPTAAADCAAPQGVVEPLQRGTDDRPLIVFPASALARQGALELSAAMQGLPCRLRVPGSCASDPCFWGDVPVVQGLPDADPLDGAALVVLPAHVAPSPRLLLRALNLGLPVVATPQCGLGDMPGLTLVPAGDVQALRLALQRSLAQLRA